MAVGMPTKRRKVAEVQVKWPDTKRAEKSAAAAVSAVLGRRVRVFLNPMSWGARGGAAAPTVGSSSSTVIRVIFPDGYVMEARFDRGETVQQLVELIRRAVRRPDLPFYIYTAPPKERVVDMSVDFHTAGFVPGANVYFCWETSVGEGVRWLGPCLRDEARSLQWVDLDLQDV